jgi:hypothetical protein
MQLLGGCGKEMWVVLGGFLSSVVPCDRLHCPLRFVTAWVAVGSLVVDATVTMTTGSPLAGALLAP